jgi:hypothetical protein
VILELDLDLLEKVISD